MGRKRSKEANTSFDIGEERGARKKNEKNMINLKLRASN